MTLRQTPPDWICRPIEEVKQISGFPSDADFCGYVVHLRDTDEFLMSAKTRGGATIRAWSKRPDDARVFKSHKQAWAFALDCDKHTPEVVHLFETPTQFLVTVYSDDADV